MSAVSFKSFWKFMLIFTLKFRNKSYLPRTCLLYKNGRVESWKTYSLGISARMDFKHNPVTLFILWMNHENPKIRNWKQLTNT